MKFVDLIYISVQNFKNHKSRNFMTILGVSVGIGAILFLVALGYGLQKLLLEKITTNEALLTLDVVTAESRVVILNKETVAEISEIPGIEKVSTQATFLAQVSMNDSSAGATVNLVNSDFFALSGRLPQWGSVFKTEEAQKIVVNAAFTNLFSPSAEQILGKRIKILLLPSQQTEENGELKDLTDSFRPLGEEKELEVVGVIEESSSVPEIYANSAGFPDISIVEYQFAKVKARTDKDMEAAREQLINKGFLVSALSDTVTQANKIFGVLQVVLSIFGIIALVVAAIGLINTMTISLLERTNEIGIMRAIGASPADIKKLFLGDSLMIGFLGGLGGIILGYVVARLSNFGINLLAKVLGGKPVNIFYFPPWFIIFILVLSAVVGLIGGYWPARRAAKLDPLEALKYK